MHSVGHLIRTGLWGSIRDGRESLGWGGGGEVGFYAVELCFMENTVLDGAEGFSSGLLG
jgi:hypothetical protein